MNNLKNKINTPIKCPKCNYPAQRNGGYPTKTRVNKLKYFCIDCRHSFVIIDPDEEFEEVTLEDIFIGNTRNLKNLYEELLIQKVKTNKRNEYIKIVFRVLVENNIPIKIIYVLFNKKYSIRTLERMKSNNTCDIKRIKDYQFIYDEKEYYGDDITENILTIDKIGKMFKNFENKANKDEAINDFINDFYKLTILTTIKDGKKRSLKWKQRKKKPAEKNYIIDLSRFI